MSLRNCRSRTRPAEGATERVSNHMPPMDGISSFRCIESCIVNPDRQARGNNKKKRKQEQEQPTHSTSNSHASAIISAAPLQASEDASPLLTNPPIRALCSALVPHPPTYGTWHSLQRAVQYQVSTGLHKVIRDRASRPQRGHSCAQNTVKAAAPGRLAVGDALTPGTSQLTPPPSSRREPAPFHSQHDKRTGLPLSGVAAGVANDAAGLLDAVGARHVRGAELHGDALRPSRCSENAPTTYLYRRVLCCAVRVQQGIMPVHHAAETNSTLAEALPSRAARDGVHSTTGPCRRSTRARSSAYSSSLHRSLAEVLTPPASRPLRTRLLHAKNRRAQAEPRPAKTTIAAQCRADD